MIVIMRRALVRIDIRKMFHSLQLNAKLINFAFYMSVGIFHTWLTKLTNDRNNNRKVGRHYNDVIMSTMASQVTSLAIVYSTVYSGADQRKPQSSASLAFVRGIHRWIPRTNGQLRGKCFHLMTSWYYRVVYSISNQMLQFLAAKSCFCLPM